MTMHGAGAGLAADRQGALRSPAGAVTALIARICLVAWLALLLAPALDARADETAGFMPRWQRQADDGSQHVRLYVFWSTRCPHCHRALEFLGGLRDELPWLEVIALEVSDPINANRYQEFAAALGVEAVYVPAFFYCGTAFHGYADDQTTGQHLRDGLDACYQRMTGQSAQAAPAETSIPPITIPLVGTIDAQTLFCNRAARVKGSKLAPARRMMVWQGPLFCPRSAQAAAASWGQARARCINLRSCVVAGRANSSGRR